MQRRTLISAGLALSTLLGTPAAMAQSYPSKAIKLVVPYAAGGATDITARTLGEKLATRLGQPVLVDNRGGAGGVTGADQALKAPADGILIDVTGEPGQVVAAGQTVALLAQGAREVEVFLPEGVVPPAKGKLSLPGGATDLLRLREVSGALDPLGRTRRARYTIAGGGDSLALGSVVNARFDLDSAAATGAGAVAPVFALPLGALDERGRLPQVWRVHNGQVVPVPVHVLAMDDRQARVQGPLSSEDRVVALGTHLLREGLAVRVKEAK